MCIFYAALAACQAMFGVLSWTPTATFGRPYHDIFTLYTSLYLLKFILQILYLLHHLYTFPKPKDVSLANFY